MKKMSVFIAADHAGFILKEKLLPELKKMGLEIQDFSPTFKAGDDYPVHGRRLGQAMARHKTARGLVICGSGVGVCIAANRIKGVRALVGSTSKEIKRARHDDDVNVLCLSGWDMTPAQAKNLIHVFLTSPFGKSTRYARRIKQLDSA